MKFSSILAGACASISLALASSPTTAQDDAPAIASDFQMKRCVNMGNALEAPNGLITGAVHSS